MIRFRSWWNGWGMALRMAKGGGMLGKGDHEVWRNGSVTVTIVQARTVSPKVVRDALRAIERSTQDD